MSNFIVPMSSLPSITSLTEAKQPNVLNNVSGNIPFSDYLSDALQNVVSTTADTQSGMLDLALGDTDDLHTGAIEAVKTTTAVNYATSLVSKAIQSYNEIIRMQI